MSRPMKKMTPFLWFPGNQAAEAAKYYVSVFKQGSKVTASNPMSTAFVLRGQHFIALNGNAKQPFNDAYSTYVHCKTQKEVDALWARLIGDGGTETMCGWLRDKYGLAWQIVPAVLPKLLGAKNRVKAQAAITAMMQMKKIDGPALQRAFDDA